MPNWVKNIVHIEGPEADVAKAIELMRDKNVDDNIDFENIIPVPKRLWITASSHDKYYAALYIKTLSDDEIRKLQDKLSECPVSFYGTYLKKYADSFTIAKGFMDIPENNLNWMKSRFEKEYESISHKTMEDVGKAYIDNILEYGHDTWYEWCVHNWGTKWNAAECTIGDNCLEFETAWDPSIPITVELSKRFPSLKFIHEWADEGLYQCGKSEIYNGIETEFINFEDTDEMHEFACMLWGYDPDEE